MRILLFSCQMSVLLCILWALFHGPLQAPVASQHARSPAAHGKGWHVGGIHTTYLTKEYALEQVRNWVALGLSSDDPAVQAAAEREARRHARKAIASTPTSGYAWASLGWVELMAGDRDAALDAVARARRWAPAAPPLALDRVLISQQWWLELDATDRDIVLDDVLIASRAVGNNFRQLTRESPFLALLLVLARNRDAE